MAGVTTAELVEALMRSAHRLRRASAKSLAPLGLTPTQERMLRLVSRGETPWRMGELANRMGIVPRSATGLVDGLEAAGLVVRSADPDNRRAVLVHLTDHGRLVQAGMAQARADAGEHLFAALNDRERTVLADLLDKVAPPEPAVKGSFDSGRREWRSGSAGEPTHEPDPGEPPGRGAGTLGG